MKCINRSKGMTLIEVMIVVVIVSILAAIAIPSYQSYVLETKRSEGTGELMRIMDLQERYYLNQFPPSYVEDLTELGLADPFKTENEYYSISAKACSGATIGNCVTLTATAQAEVADDGDLTLDSRGNRTRGGNTGWD